MRSNNIRNRGRGRPLKERPVSKAVISAFLQAPGDPFPKDSQTLRALAKALLVRIERKDAKEGKMLRAWVHYLTAIQSLASARLNSLAQLLKLGPNYELQNIVLDEISSVSTKGRSKDHFESAIEIQYCILQTFLQEHPYQGSKVEWGTYWEQHQNDIVSTLTRLPCFCAYETMRPAASWKVRPDRCSSPGEFIELVLACLHGASPRTIRAALLAAFPSK
ncbi:MAG: hypothetical protein U0223_08270 [Nitrospira sp.]|nr:hypothetical protein [Nitrospira sp.]